MDIHLSLELNLLQTSTLIKLVPFHKSFRLELEKRLEQKVEGGRSQQGVREETKATQKLNTISRYLLYP